MTEQVNYEEKYVCFLDILGFSNAILNPESHPIYHLTPGYFKNVMARLNYTKAIESCYQGLKIYQFSDSLIIISPVDYLTLFQIIPTLVSLQDDLLGEGLLVRGAITKGAMYNDERNIFGPALVNAARLEKKAQVPIIVISPEVMKDHYQHQLQGAKTGYKIDFINNTIIEYKNKNNETIKEEVQFVDYIQAHFNRYNSKTPPTQEDTNIVKTISHYLEDTESDYFKKYKWFAEKWNKIVEEKGLHINLKITIPPQLPQN